MADRISNEEAVQLTRRAWVEHMAKEPAAASGWVPVGERLPEVEGWYECTIHEPKGIYTRPIWWPSARPGWALGPGREVLSSRVRVTAWKPLPAPYQPPRAVPTEPGWWWYRPGEGHAWLALRVGGFPDGTKALNDGAWWSITDMQGTWGPRIEEPS